MSLRRRSARLKIVRLKLVVYFNRVWIGNALVDLATLAQARFATFQIFAQGGGQPLFTRRPRRLLAARLRGA